MINWKLPPQVEKAVYLLKNNQESVFLVGGALRDLFLNRQPKDWDLVTSASAVKIQQLFPKSFVMGKKQETINVSLDGLNLEISPYRLASKNILEDLSKRDFTINAIAYEVENQKIIDPFSGITDIKKKLIRAVENPIERLREDPLRMLRALRLMAQYNFRLAPSLLEVIPQEAYLLKETSMERIRDELARILLTDKVTDALILAEKLGLLPIFLPELSRCFGVEQNAFHHLDVAGHIFSVIEHLPKDNLELRIVGLLHDLGKPHTRSIGEDGRVHFYGHENYSAQLAKAVLKRLKISNQLLGIPVNAQRIIHLVKNHMFFYRKETSDKAVRRLLSRLKPENVNAFLVFQRADILAGSPAKQERLPDVKRLEITIKKILAQQPPLEEKDLALTGKEIMSVLQMSPSRRVGEIKRKLLQAVIENPELNSKDDLINLLEKEKSTP